MFGEQVQCRSFLRQNNIAREGNNNIVSFMINIKTTF